MLAGAGTYLLRTVSNARTENTHLNTTCTSFRLAVLRSNFTGKRARSGELFANDDAVLSAAAWPPKAAPNAAAAPMTSLLCIIASLRCLFSN